MFIEKYPYMAPDGGEGGGAAAPAAPPTAPAAPAPAGEESSPVQWDEYIADDSEEFAHPATDDPPAGEAQPPTQAQPVATPAAPAAPTQPAAPQPPTVAPAPQPAAPAQPTAEQQAERDAQVKAARESMRAELAGIYEKELDDETKQALIADPATVMPKLLAQAAMDGAQLAMAQLVPMLPQVVHQTAAQQQGVARAWSEFDAVAPDLAKPEYRRATVAAIQFVKGSGNKYSTKQEAMDAVARMVRASMNLPQPGQPAAQPSPQAAPVAPHTPVARGAARQPASKGQSNPWVDLLDD